MTLYTTGYYYALFYLQLDAIKHGIEPTFAFYTVRSLLLHMHDAE
jgi:hypothetical protein